MFSERGMRLRGSQPCTTGNCGTNRLRYEEQGKLCISYTESGLGNFDLERLSSCLNRRFSQAIPHQLRQLESACSEASEFLEEPWMNDL